MRSTPQIIAHRGGPNGSLVENSSQAIEHACFMGVDGIEIDVHLLNDRSIAVYHDFHLKKSLHSQSPEATDVLHPLRHLDQKKFKSHLLNTNPPEAPPLLEDVIRMIQKQKSPPTLWIELKTIPLDPLSSDPLELTAHTIEILQKFSLEKNTVLLSFDWRTLIYASILAPTLKTSYIADVSKEGNMALHLNRPSPWLADISLADFNGCFLQAIASCGGFSCSMPYQQLNQNLIHKAHSLGLHVNVWTPNQEEDFHPLFHLDVDSITTDFPKSLLEFRSSYSSDESSFSSSLEFSSP